MSARPKSTNNHEHCRERGEQRKLTFIERLLEANLDAYLISISQPGFSETFGIATV